jgi:hypothetical protein
MPDSVRRATSAATSGIWQKCRSCALGRERGIKDEAD